MVYPVSLLNYLPVNENIKAVLVSALVSHYNHPQQHAYLGFDAYQENCDADQKTTYLQHTFDAHGTIHRQELIVPWNSRENNSSTNLIINITSSYNTGHYLDRGNLNYFQIELVGYII
ncbi:unnamed protein product [Rotaria sp. Silwood2]|nr:unnamed protein product [Rotaria sp. Silwood2]